MEEDGQIFTPLAVAARNGRLKVVKMLLTMFKPNIDQECTAKFDGHIVQGATALWCAAGSGKQHFKRSIFKMINKYVNRALECNQIIGKTWG